MPHRKKTQEEKPKKEFVFDSPELLAGVSLDKAEEEEVLVEGETGEDAAEVTEFDEEEIDPFKDKWEE